jgi:hypothetical protein
LTLPVSGRTVTMVVSAVVLFVRRGSHHLF